MNHASYLSIFRFHGQDDGRKARSTPALQAAVTVQDPQPEQTAVSGAGKDRIVIDLENLTPETLEAFFPSEHETTIK
ncbi:MAG: hypothetical protein ACRD4C_12135 [Candidatus Acidiferrales bacterium]